MALMEKSISDANATLKILPDASFAKSVEPWLGVMEHSAGHYGLLPVAYYRANGLVPTAAQTVSSRPRHGRATKETGTAALVAENER